ncbi:MAG: DNA polymerase III subunit gamma/tau [Planctomycetia bacterium]|nr:DNA polymerase III subunit gamma/tau [Planctomycetia bacterium]
MAAVPVDSTGPQHAPSAAASDQPAAAADGRYMVVARRYRPQSFTELIGQEHVAKALSAAIDSSRVGHAYLFTGARGVGKTSAARILAKALDCVTGPTPTPCNECDICQSIASGSDVDVMEIDGASNRGIEEIRQLRSNVGIRPSRAKFKIYIIDEVHMLTREAFNALLKTLEEPPEHVKFIFCTTEPTKIPITVLSRCQRFDFAGIQSRAIADRLADIVRREGLEAEPEALALIARRAAGSMRDSQSLLEQLLPLVNHRIDVADVHALLGTADSQRLLSLVRHLVSSEPAAALADLDAVVGEGVDVGELLDQILGVLRDAMASAAGCSGDTLLFAATTDEQQAVAEIGQALGLERILAMFQVVEETLSRLRYSTHRRTLAEIAIVRICRLENLEDLRALAAQIAAGGTGVPTMSSAPAAKKKLTEGSPTVPVRPEPAPPQPIRPEPTRIASPPPKPADAVAPQPSRPAHTPAPSPPSHPSNSSHAPPPPTVASINDELASSDEPDQYSSTEDGGYSDSDTASSTTSFSSAPAEPTSTSPSRLTEDTADAVWKESLDRLSGMVAAKAKSYHQVAARGPNRLEVTFAQTYNFCKSFCEQPERLAMIEATVSEIVGQKVRVTFVVANVAPTRTDQPEAPKPPSALQRMKAVHENPLVRRASELFGAKPVNIE